MRAWIFVLTFCAGTLAFCQPPGAVLQSPQRPGGRPHTFNWPGTDFSKIPPAWRSSSIPTQAIIVQHEIAPASRLGNARIDPGMIVHPPKSSFGASRRGRRWRKTSTPASGIFRSKFQCEAETDPDCWPDLKLQPIPLHGQRRNPVLRAQRKLAISLLRNRLRRPPASWKWTSRISTTRRTCETLTSALFY